MIFGIGLKSSKQTFLAKNPKGELTEKLKKLLNEGEIFDKKAIAKLCNSTPQTLHSYKMVQDFQEDMKKFMEWRKAKNEAGEQ